jgi:hypothetical protein
VGARRRPSTWRIVLAKAERWATRCEREADGSSISAEAGTVLSPDERRLLAGIEQHLGADDPRLARLLVPDTHRTRRIPSWVLSALIAVSALCVVTGLVTAELNAFLGGVVILMPSLWLLVRRRRRPDPGRPGDTLQ